MKKTVIFVMMAICSIGMYGQTTSEQDEVSKKKEINGIKLSEEAVYADVIEMATDDNEAVSLAQQKSINLLQTHVIEIFAKRMNMKKADVQEIWDVIDDKCQNIVVRKGDLCRVFTYIMKDALGLTRKKPKKEDVEKYLGKDTTEQADSTSMKEAVAKLTDAMTGSKDSINVVPEKKVEVATVEKQVAEVVPAKEEVKAVVAEEPKAKADTLVAVTTVIVKNPTEETTAKVVNPEPETKVVTPQPEPKVVTPAVEEPKTVDVQVPELCQEMIEQGNMHKLLVYLGVKKTENKLMYGNVNKMQYIERCYIVLVDKKSLDIVGVLDKGMNERMNFVTKQMDHYKNYKNGQYKVILVQEY